MPTASPSATEPGVGRRPGPLGAVALGVLAAGVLLDVDRVSDGPVLCPFRRFAGVPCPGCGLTRSVVATLDGRVADGFGFHPLGPLLVAVFAVIVAVQADGWRRSRVRRP
jgi:hypothetical protein